MTKEAKARYADKALAIVYTAGKNIEARKKNGSVKIRKLESNNRDVDRDSDESNIDKSLDSLRPVEMLSVQSCSATLSFSQSNVRILYRLPHFASDRLREKPSY